MICRFLQRTAVAALVTCGLAECALAQQPRALTWQELKDRFEAGNPSLQAAKLAINESKADEVTAYLRPNPFASVISDQVQIFGGQPLQPFSFLLSSVSVSYLHE